MKIISFLFRATCFFLFSYESYKCLEEYINQQPITKDWHSMQEKFPMPQICFTTLGLTFVSDKYNDSDFKRYKNGVWNFDNTTEEELFEAITPKLSDLISEITFNKLKSNVGDNYEKIRVSVSNSTEMERSIKVNRKDYYAFLKTYCLTYRFGLQNNYKVKSII